MGKREESRSILVQAVGKMELPLAEMRRGIGLGRESENRFGAFVVLGRVDI